jgi:hypothetical protein
MHPSPMTNRSRIRSVAALCMLAPSGHSNLRCPMGMTRTSGDSSVAFERGDRMPPEASPPRQPPPQQLRGEHSLGKD